MTNEVASLEEQLEFALVGTEIRASLLRRDMNDAWRCPHQYASFSSIACMREIQWGPTLP